jgi:hypothetical protein
MAKKKGRDYKAKKKDRDYMAKKKGRDYMAKKKDRSDMATKKGRDTNNGLQNITHEQREQLGVNPGTPKR